MLRGVRFPRTAPRKRGIQENLSSKIRRIRREAEKGRYVSSARTAKGNQRGGTPHTERRS